MTPTQHLITQAFSHLHPQLDLTLAPLTYFKIGGAAEVFLDITQKEDAVKLLDFCTQQQLKVTLLAGASNVIVADEGIPGVVIRLSNENYETLPPEGEKRKVRLGAGFKTALAVRKTMDEGLAGLEYFLGVPGRLGGAVYNNAHYLSHLVGEFISAVEVWSHSKGVQWLPHDQCEFGYDSSRFQTSGEVILSIEFILPPGTKEESLRLIREATEYRAKTQPLGEPSSGCYFQNTPNTPELQQQFPQFAAKRELPAGFLIDQAGLKGEKVGGISVSHKHASFLVNDGTGNSHQVLELAEKIRTKVHQLYKVELKEEVFFLD
jgi:UDP-N-acetylmuramate dehydrogenase